ERAGRSPLPWEREGLKLSVLLQGWRAEKERARPGLVWLRSLRPPALHLGTAQKMVLSGHTHFVYSVAFSTDGKRIVSGSSDCTVKVWDAHSGEEILTLQGHSTGVTSVSFSVDGKRLVSGSEDRTVMVWDAQTGQELLSLKGHTGGVTSVVFSADGTRIA